MLRRRQQTCLVALTLLLIAPASARAQQSGAIAVDNNTGTTIRIGCEYYTNSLGQQVNLKAYWDLAPGAKTRLNGPDGMGLFAQKFVFFVITPEGESGGWNFATVDAAGQLRFQLDGGSLANHRQRAGLSVSNYPALTARDRDVANLNALIAQDEQNLQRLDIAIPAARVALTAAQAAYNRLLNDPNAKFAQTLLAAGAVTAAEATLNTLNNERATVQSRLATNRQQRSTLQAQPN
jgi:hypothetical protein